MAGDSAITAVKALRNDVVDFSTAAVNAKDTGFAYLDVSTMDGSKVIFLVDRGGAKNPTLTVFDGGSTSNPTYFSGGSQGNLTELTTAGGEYIIGPLETARFKDSDGYIKIGKSTADTATLYTRAILLP